MSSSPADNIRSRIISELLNDGLPVFVGMVPTDATNAISVYDTGGTHANADAEHDDPTVMVRVQHRDYDSGYALLYRIQRHFLASLGMRIADWHYTGFWLLSGINRVGQDDQQREVFTLNLRAMREPIPPVDKSSLVAALDAAAELNEGDYTPESWVVLAAAVDAGQIVYDDDEATQMQVDAAAMAIDAAIEGLIPVDIACSFPLSTDITALLPGSLPLIISGADSQTVSTGVDPAVGTYLASSGFADTYPIGGDAGTAKVIEVVFDNWMQLGSDIEMTIQGGHLYDNNHRSSIAAMYRGHLPQKDCLVQVAYANVADNIGIAFAEFYLPERPERAALVSGADGRAWLVVDGQAEALSADGGDTDYTGMPTGMASLLAISTVDSSTTGEGVATFITDAADMTSVIPALPGVTSVTDLCGNPVEVTPIWQPATMTAGYKEISIGEGTYIFRGFIADDAEYGPVGSNSNEPYLYGNLLALGHGTLGMTVVSQATFQGDLTAPLADAVLLIDNVPYEQTEPPTLVGGETTLTFETFPAFVDEQNYDYEFIPGEAE